MKEIINRLQIFGSILGGYLGWLLGGIDGFLYVLVVFVIIDYITGVMLAVLEKRVSSDIGFRGIFKKVLIFLIVAMGNIIDFYLIKDGSAIRTAIIFFYISNEGISIIENAAKIGLPVPEKIKKVLEELTEDDAED